jgi:hypothetical protein
MAAYIFNPTNLVYENQFENNSSVADWACGSGSKDF